jgi:hypothetical protein
MGTVDSSLVADSESLYRNLVQSRAYRFRNRRHHFASLFARWKEVRPTVFAQIKL